MKPKIGVWGYSGRTTSAIKDKAFAIGRAIGEEKAILITGATTGIPFEAARGAKMAGGEVIGISPAESIEQHVNRYEMPIEFHDFLIFTGFGYIGRNVINVRTVDAGIIINGGVGTLNELAGTYAHRKPIGVLLGTGGIAESTEDLQALMKDERFDTPIVYDQDPVKLVKKLITMVKA